MKKILFFLLSLIILASCGKDEPSANKGKLDPNAMILIRPAAGVRATVSGLTALEIVEQGHEIQFTTRYSDDKYNEERDNTPARGFAASQRDFDIPALKMWGIDVINQDGEYIRDFTHATNVIITNNNGDTIAYVPDKVISDARPLIEAAYADENYDEVYRLFNEAFTFLPYK